MTQTSILPSDYLSFLKELKQQIRQAQLRAGLAANRELIYLYWNIGCSILERQEKEGWGAKIIDRLSMDLKKEFPDMRGFSSRNLKYMRAFAETWPDESIVQQLVAQIPWGHNLKLLDIISDNHEREWYAGKTIENGWSRNVMVHQIESGLYHRQGKALTNFPETLPAPQSELAQQLLKDPYTFDFLTIEEKARERELEKDLLLHLRDFLIELGRGFAFLGSQYPLTVGDNDYAIDLLFYNVKLHCYVVLELKIDEFKPEYAGKMNFYLSAVDDQLADQSDNPSIGIILCKTRDKVTVEYALKDTRKPIGVAAYRLTKSLSGKLKQGLPSIEELKDELAGS